MRYDLRCVCVFFQAEDGIRYLVRSRGLGDVYKRQGAGGVHDDVDHLVDGGVLDHHLDPDLGDEVDGVFGAAVNLGVALLPAVALDLTAVSYTHLTLPPSDLV